MFLSILRIIIWLWAFSLVPLVGCSDTAAPPPNKPPTIEFTVDKLAVPREIEFTLTVDVDDPDGDPVSVTWAVTRDGQASGSLEETEQGGTAITWTPPAATGRDTITAVATDGKGGSATLVETIQVGTLQTEDILGFDRTWSLSTSPHIVRGDGTDLVIAARRRLAIEAGVEVYIDRPGFTIKSAGRIESGDPAGAPVVIRPNTRTPEPGYWMGFEATPDGAFAPQTTLSNTEILYAENAVKSNMVAEARLDGCKIKFCSESAVLHGSSGELRVENSVITNNEKSGIRIVRGVGVAKPVNVVITGDSLAVNGDVTGQTAYRDQAAIFIDMPDTNAVTPIEISHNEISRNGTPGIQLVTGVFPEIHQNLIFGNEFGKAGTRYNIILGEYGGNGFGGGSYPDIVDARDNYWGGSYAEADSSTIRATIRDSENPGGVPIDALVVIYPWLNVEP
jgi:hypothetical protein